MPPGPIPHLPLLIRLGRDELNFFIELHSM